MYGSMYVCMCDVRVCAHMLKLVTCGSIFGEVMND